MNKQLFSLGATESPKDIRTIKHSDLSMATSPLVVGGYDYGPDDIEDQRRVGICTAISKIQNEQFSNKKKYSADFHYLLQKKFFDKNWDEGSSIFHALKVAKTYGFLPEELWTHTKEEDRLLSYSQYIEKLKAVPDDEILRLIKLCINNIPGYAWVDPYDPQALAKAIVESKAGILCRYEVGKEWWTAPINPLRPPQQTISGHAIIMSKFDYTNALMQVLANTWGKDWNKAGKADVNYSQYKPTEAWTIVNKILFIKDLRIGMTHPDIKRLQQFLNTHGFTVSSSGAGSNGQETEYFGLKTIMAVFKFQSAYGILRTGFVGPLTRQKINFLL